MSPARDPIALLRLALRDGDLELAAALVKSFRTSSKLARRADAELRATPRLRDDTFVRKSRELPNVNEL